MSKLYSVTVDATLYDTFEVEAEYEEVAIMKAKKLFDKLYNTARLRDVDLEMIYEAYLQETDND